MYSIVASYSKIEVGVVFGNGPYCTLKKTVLSRVLLVLQGLLPK